MRKSCAWLKREVAQGIASLWVRLAGRSGQRWKGQTGWRRGGRDTVGSGFTMHGVNGLEARL
jgi:hypothetical protein